MSFLVKEYSVPFLGKIELIESSGYDSSINGAYYAKNEKLGEFCKNCKSVEEIITKVGEKVKNYFTEQKVSTEVNIENKKRKIDKLETLLGNFPNAEENGKIEEWLKKYQTENPLQLEYQNAERQKENKK